ncbi:uncharacterized protein LOC135249971 isoform X1 [Anguilla rostrata]|uniref:uncharacterized protein LOC135249971 isoform X1 n=1 Tax=Anguilla rostrata TaxID=7938 RepID=UPI0030D3AAE5
MARTYISVLMLYGTSLIGRALLAEVHSVAAKRGYNVRLPCSFRMSGAGGYMGWFRHGPNDSVPLCIFSVYDGGHSEVKHHNKFRQEHIKLHWTNSSFDCEIINVDLSDSGLYFCGQMTTSKLVFDSATRVEVEGQMSPTTTEEGHCEESVCVSHFPILWALGGVSAIQLVVIFVLVCRVAGTGKASQHNSDNKRVDEDPETLNYAALNFAQNRKKPRRREELDTHVVYAATR